MAKKLLADLVPTNWCDELLTGPNGIGSPPYNCQHIEKLLLNVRARILRAEAPSVTPKMRKALAKLERATKRAGKRNEAIRKRLRRADRRGVDTPEGLSK